MRQALKGRRALVTGASGGLGVAFATELAAQGADLILVARREDQLRKVAAELAASHGIVAEILVMDLSGAEAGRLLFEATEGRGKTVDILVNNAGYGLYGPFLELAWEKERNMLELDMLTLTDATKRFGQAMACRGWGRMLQVASIGGFQPTPLYASYSAAKSYVLNFSEALNYEWRGSGVSCTAISPGITATDFLKVSGQQATLYQRLAMMQPGVVGRIGIRAMIKGKSSVVPGLINKITILSNRLMPRTLSAAVAHLVMK